MKKPSVAIGYLERFASDFERESGHITVPEVAHANGIKVPLSVPDLPGYRVRVTWQNWVTM